MSFELIILIGVQGTGKSTWAKQYIKDNPDIVYLSTDEIWMSIGPMSDRTLGGKIYSTLTQKTEESLKNGKSVLLDATFVKKRWRKSYIELGRKYGAKIIFHIFSAPREVLRQRIDSRTKNGGIYISDEVLNVYQGIYQPPDQYEFDEIFYHQS